MAKMFYVWPQHPRFPDVNCFHNLGFVKFITWNSILWPLNVELGRCPRHWEPQIDQLQGYWPFMSRTCGPRKWNLIPYRYKVNNWHLLYAKYKLHNLLTRDYKLSLESNAKEIIQSILSILPLHDNFPSPFRPNGLNVLLLSPKA